MLPRAACDASMLPSMLPRDASWRLDAAARAFDLAIPGPWGLRCRSRTTVCACLARPLGPAVSFSRHAHTVAGPCVHAVLSEILARRSGGGKMKGCLNVR